MTNRKEILSKTVILFLVCVSVRMDQVNIASSHPNLKYVLDMPSGKYQNTNLSENCFTVVSCLLFDAQTSYFDNLHVRDLPK